MERLWYYLCQTRSHNQSSARFVLLPLHFYLIINPFLQSIHRSNPIFARSLSHHLIFPFNSNSHIQQICKKSFKRPQDLKKHEKIHTEEHHQQHKHSKAVTVVDPLYISRVRGESLQRAFDPKAPVLKSPTTTTATGPRAPNSRATSNSSSVSDSTLSLSLLTFLLNSILSPSHIRYLLCSIAYTLSRITPSTP